MCKVASCDHRAVVLHIARLEAENEKLRTQVALYVAALKSVSRFNKVTDDDTWAMFDSKMQVLQERIAMTRKRTQDIKQSLAVLKARIRRHEAIVRRPRGQHASVCC